MRPDRYEHAYEVRQIWTTPRDNLPIGRLCAYLPFPSARYWAWMWVALVGPACPTLPFPSYERPPYIKLSWLSPLAWGRSFYFFLLLLLPSHLAHVSRGLTARRLTIITTNYQASVFSSLPTSPRLVPPPASRFAFADPLPSGLDLAFPPYLRFHSPPRLFVFFA